MSCRGTRGVAMLLVAVAMVSGCTKSQVHLQEPSPSPSPTTAGSASPSTDPSSATPVVKPIPTPTVLPAAQGAVDAYVAFVNATVIADRDPAHADLSFIDKYLSGNAKTMYSGVYPAMRKEGLASRGTPGDPRIKVSAVLSPTAVVLTSCLTTDKVDPYTEYYIATGKPVPTITRKPPPPYLLILTMKVVGGSWKLIDVLQNTSKTCGG